MADAHPNPTADDPYVATAPAVAGGEEPSAPTRREREAIEMAHHDPEGQNGPSYEKNQDPEDATGGSTDPHNTVG